MSFSVANLGWTRFLGLDVQSLVFVQFVRDPSESALLDAHSMAGSSWKVAFDALSNVPNHESSNLFSQRDSESTRISNMDDLGFVAAGMWDKFQKGKKM